MDYQQITCVDTGKTMKAERIYKIRDEENMENIVSICNNCPFADSDNPKCQNCYGTIVQSYTRNFNEQSGRVKMDAVNYKNTFCKVGDEYMEMMTADEFINTMEIVANLNSSNWNHGQRIADKLRAYSFPRTYKTDCLNCKARCSKKGIKPACVLAGEYAKEHGIDVNFASSKQIEKLELPENCICSEQVQTCYFV